MESEIGPDESDPSRPTEPAGADGGVSEGVPAGAPFRAFETDAGDPLAPADDVPFAAVEPAPPTVVSSMPPPSMPPPPPGLPPYPPQAWPGYGQAPAGPYGYPPQGAPQYGSPQYSAPQYGSPQFGYQPYGYGYGYPPQPPRGTNGMAIAALVLGICGFFFVTPILGLILGIAGLATVRRTGQKGKGLAVSGIALSSAWIALFAVLITVAVINMPDPPRRDVNGTVVSPGSVSVFGLHPKDCFTMPAGVIGSTKSHLRNLTVVPCSTPHDSEAFGSFTADGDSYPGSAALRADGNTKCLHLLDSFVPDPFSLPSDTRIQFVYPNSQAWGDDERRVSCFLQFPSATMTQSVYHDPASYTADQRRFLAAVTPLADAIGDLSETPQDADLSVLRQRADAIATAAQSEVSALTSAPWPDNVQTTVNSLAASHQNMAQLWTQAANDSDLTTFDQDRRRADIAYDLPEMTSLRTALGLATTRPTGGATQKTV